MDRPEGDEHPHPQMGQRLVPKGQTWDLIFAWYCAPRQLALKKKT
jgi:hypothetical protein